MNRAKSTSRPAEPLDRISGLPGSILSHIISFLPAEDAVASRILSKSWSSLWRSINNLDFSYKNRKDFEFSDFVNFVNYVMLYHKPDAGYLNKLSLTLSGGDAWINAWICSAVAKNVRELFVSCWNYNPPIHVQTCMFTSEWLQSLELKCGIRISSEITVSLPRLEHLKLIIISFYASNAEAYRKLINGCPVLKYLYIDVGSCFSKCFIISSTSLRHLEVNARYTRIRDAAPDSIWDRARMSSDSINLDAPSLEYIKLRLSKTSCITFIQGSFTSLEEADFQPYLLPSALDSAVKAVQAFDCAKALTLSADVMEALCSATIKLSTKFKRLTRLEVTLDLNHWSVLQDLISLSDNLEVLTTKKGYQTRADDLTSSNWKTPNLVPRCLSNSLKTVSISDYYDHVDELATVAYTLEHGSVLQRMQICFDKSITDFKTKFEILQKIIKFPRKSLCEVECC